MKLNTNLLIENAGKIATESGVQHLTIEKLAKKLKVREETLMPWFTTDDDIPLMLIKAFEDELKKYITRFTLENESPETELFLLFKRLYFIFLQKPYYLSVLFEGHLINRNYAIKNSLIRIQALASNYLSKLIDKGIKNNIFSPNIATKSLVNNILKNFRIYMSDEYYINKMIRDLKQLKQ